MKKLIALIITIFLSFMLHAQPNPNLSDSLKIALFKTNADTSRVRLLRVTGFRERNLTTLLQSLALAKKIKYSNGEAECNNAIGNYFFGNSNYTKAMEFYLQCLQISEETNYLSGITFATANIGAVYLKQGDYRQGLNYCLRALSISKSINNVRGIAVQSYDIARAYFQLNKPDSALFYGNQSYQNAIVSKDSNALTNSLHTLGDIHESMGNTKLSLEYYRMAIPYTAGFVFTLPDIYVSMAKLFRQTGQMDSCLAYAEKGLQSAQEHNNGDIVFKSAGLLSALYEKQDVNKSFNYYKIAVAGKDSMFSAEKVKQIENLSYNEMLRQQEREGDKLKATEERNRNLQYAAIGFSLISFIILFLLFSHSIIANEKVIRFLGVVALLLVFEFINLFIHPFIGELTHHTPLLMLLIMVCVAALLVPAHHQLEHWITHKMVEKNKRIRLAAAKKTIAKLEGNGETSTH